MERDGKQVTGKWNIPMAEPFMKLSLRKVTR
jgi:hypothetical protein